MEELLTGKCKTDFEKWIDLGDVELNRFYTLKGNTKELAFKNFLKTRNINLSIKTNTVNIIGTVSIFSNKNGFGFHHNDYDIVFRCVVKKAVEI